MITPQYITDRHRIIMNEIAADRLKCIKPWRPIVDRLAPLIPEDLKDVTQESLDALLFVDNIRNLSRSQTARAYGYERISPLTPVGIFELTGDLSILERLPPREFFDGVKIPIIVNVWVGSTGKCLSRTCRLPTKKSKMIRYVEVSLAPREFIAANWMTLANAICHEFAHSIDRRKLFEYESIDALYGWLKSKFLANKRSILDHVHSVWAEGLKDFHGTRKDVVIVNWPYIRYLDILGTIEYCPIRDPSIKNKTLYYHGHPREYYIEAPGFRRMEFIADCVDMVWDNASATVMNDIDPEFYKKAKEVFLGYWRK